MTSQPTLFETRRRRIRKPKGEAWRLKVAAVIEAFRPREKQVNEERNEMGNIVSIEERRTKPPVQTGFRRICLVHGLEEMIDCPCGGKAHCALHTPGQRNHCRFEKEQRGAS